MKSVAGVLFVIAIIVIVMQPDIFNAIIAFLLVGVIPGTSYRLPFWATMLLAGVLALLLVVATSRNSLMIGEVRRPRTRTVPYSNASSAEPVPHQSRIATLRARLSHRKRYQPAAHSATH